MSCARRYLVVFLGFCGLLVSIGYRSVFAMVMVHVIKSNNTNEKLAVFPHCTTNGTSRDLSLDWSSELSQLFNTGYFVGSFFTQVPGGILAVRYSAKRICGLTILISSIFMIVLPFAIQFHEILVMAIRITQGVVEGCSVPALNGVISAWAPKTEKTRMITVAYAGAYISPAVAMFISGVTACYVSWHSVLFIYGGLGVIWSLIWLFCIYDTPSDHPGLSNRERSLFDREGSNVRAGNRQIAANIPWRQILTSLPMSAVIAGSFCRNWIFSLLITELPKYFQDSYGLPIAEIGWIAALPDVFMTVVVILAGALIEKLIKSQKITTTFGRKFSECFGYQVNPLDLAPQYASILTGLSRLGSIGAILSTSIAAYISGHSPTIESWHKIFLIAGAVHMGGVVYYGIFASGEKQSWAETRERQPLLHAAAEDDTQDLFTQSVMLDEESTEKWIFVTMDT
ncbi:hypothetical protein KUTeg_018373 [Tegillarca granosa]|uniref:Major facilitator superfamily (MFS) profile domain-containing protein n=1 Tax=Tegillarca granosa TaxID=220873 RepID=A0ABQ9EHY7_TEGGR|nr:hypothetical protein KUTeg_018373 [Tegillarca granosa]